MKMDIRLEQFLASRARREGFNEDLASVLLVIADCGAKMAEIIARGGSAATPEAMAHPDSGPPGGQPLQQLSHQVFATALARLPLAFIASEKTEALIDVDTDAELAVAIDPLDGSSNIDTNTSIGSVFSVLHANRDNIYDRKLGDLLLASGFLFYGPQTRLILSCGDGTYGFLLNPDDHKFYLVDETMQIPAGRHEFAINTSNYRFWDDNVRYFIDDCVAGENGPLAEDFNMRWNASLVAEAYRILKRGGIFLYPGDSRPGYESGRLQLLFEALPLAFLIEQAGGLASDGSERILEMKLAALQTRVPLIFGSSDRVREVIDYMTGDALENTRFPLFENRSLFRN